jgi:ABC-type dipeptide/oligopeptide/nickel transport system permease subunit
VSDHTQTAEIAGPIPATAEAAEVKPVSPVRQILQRTFRQRSATIGLGLVIFICATQVIGPYIVTSDPYHINLSAQAVYDQPPSLHPFHPLGTDDLGRDIYSRLLVGGRISLPLAFFATAFAVVVGVTIGGVAGFARGHTDTLLMMVTNWFLSFPFFLLALGIIAVRNPSISSVLLALVITGWAYFTRLLRGQVLGVRETEFVEAARAAGASSTRIMRKHVLPNSMAPVIVVAILTIGANITGEAGLSFLGLGVPPPDITWGNMAGRGQAYLELNPVEVLAPSFMIAFTLIAITLFGNALRDAADPKLKD